MHLLLPPHHAEAAEAVAEDSTPLPTRRSARGAAKTATAPPAAADAAAVGAAAKPHASAAPPHHLILLRMLRFLQKIVAPLPLGTQLGERQLQQPQYRGWLLRGWGGRSSVKRIRLQRRPPHLILIIPIPLMSLLLMRNWLNTLIGRSCP